MLFTICGTILFGGFIYKCRDITNFVLDKYEQIIQIRDLVATTNNSIFSIYYNTFLLVIYTVHQMVLQNVQQTVEKINTKTYKVRYTVENKPYTMFVKVKRGPKKIWHIYDQNNVDITDDILPYFGPAVDWHGCEYVSPELLGYEKIKFVDREITKEFHDKQIIDIDLY